MKPNPGPRYMHICLCFNGRKRHTYVHTVVAQAFIGARPEGHEINHKDGNSRNNHAENLEYLAPLENVRHAMEKGLLNRGADHHFHRRPELIPRGSGAGAAKLDEAAVAKIKQLLVAGYRLGKIAEQFGVHPATISYINRNHTWTHVPWPERATP